jgi:TolA-binding protein
MKRTDIEEPKLSEQATALVGLAQSLLGEMSLQQRARGLARVNARRSQAGDAGGMRFSRAFVGAVAFGVAAALVLAGGSYLRASRSTVLAYTVEGRPASSDTTVVAEGEKRPLVRFEDGTEVQLSGGARANVAAVTEHGARIALERGELHARVAHWAGSRWLFDAGPLVVTVTGTAFSLAWSPREERFELKLESGTVAVSGAATQEPIALHAGQSLTIRLHPREIVIRDLTSDEATPTSVSSDSDAETLAPPPSAVEPVGSAAEPPAPPAPPARETRDWSAKLSAGKAEAIVAEAEGLGIESCLATATSADLAALSDAARYTRKTALAKRALLAQRQRFSGSTRAAEAAFLLGRLAEAGDGRADALSWFEKYLREAPRGAFASEALGRKMLLVGQLSGNDAATTVAREYLSRFPSGTYAPMARSLLQIP